MKKNTRLIFLAILFLVIGFAAINVTLHITGSVQLVSDNDFKVYYSKVLINGEEDKSVITDDYTITFNAKVLNVDDEYVVDYDITNSSSIFDAKISLNCTESNEYLSVINNFNTDDNLEARDTRSGTLKIKLLKKNETENIINYPISCKFDASAIGRSSVNTADVPDSIAAPLTIYNNMKQLNGIKSDISTSTSSDSGETIYYYKNKANNNIVFAEKCWNIIRTTDTKGAKLIYNGEASISTDNVNKTLLDSSDINYTNSSTHPYTYNESDSSWSGDTSETYNFGSFSFKVKEAGNYMIEMDARYSTSYGWVDIYWKNIIINDIDGEYYIDDVGIDDDIVVDFYECSYVNFKIYKINYDGTKQYICNNTGSSSTIWGDNLEFNNGNSDNSGVGYMTGSSSYPTTSYASAQSNVTNSHAKKYLERYYKYYLKPYRNYIEDTVYCNDRNLVLSSSNNTLSSSFTSLGYGGNNTAYGSVDRSSHLTINYNPTFKCINNTGSVNSTNDSFTVSSTIGNGKLTYPIGLITLDEAVFAGLNGKDSSDNYLNTGVNYWTMSPLLYDSDDIYYGIVDSTGKISNDLISSTNNYFRPVISLNSQVAISSTNGDGSTTNPYVVVKNIAIETGEPIVYS